MKKKTEERDKETKIRKRDERNQAKPEEKSKQKGKLKK